MNIVGKHKIKLKAKTVKDGMLFHIESEELENYFVHLSTRSGKLRKDYRKYQGINSYSPFIKPYEKHIFGGAYMKLHPWGNFSPSSRNGNFSFLRSVGIGGNGISFLIKGFITQLRLEHDLFFAKNTLLSFREQYLKNYKSVVVDKNEDDIPF